MTIVYSILAALCWAASVALLFRSRLTAPVVSYFGLTAAGLASSAAGGTIPLNRTILIFWLIITFVTLTATALQPREVSTDRRGMAHLVIGTVTGLAIGLLGYTVTDSVAALYAIMMLCTMGGTVLGLLVYSRSPKGGWCAPGSGRFLNTLTSKGFPTAVTLMMPGTLLVLLIAIYRIAL